MQVTRKSLAGLFGLCGATLFSLVSVGCNDGGAAPPILTGGVSGGGQTGAGGTGGVGLTVTPVSISAAPATRTARTTSWSVNYWQWSPSFGDQIPGTEAQVAAVTPRYLRVGGYNNDANTPDTFDNAKLDAMVTYARAIGAEPILQVPHLAADSSGTPATPANAAAMVQYANVTKSYGIKYFSVGNEPDLYDSAGLPSDSTKPAIPNYTPAQYCASVTAYVTAMKAVDPKIKIVGPDLSWKYQAGGDVSTDWLTPILQMCGDEFDVIAIHRYPFEAKMATLSAAAHDPVSFRQVMTSVLGILQTTGQGAKPLAVTEMNVAYDNTTGCVLGATPGTVGSALWMADILGSAIELNLWTSAVWNISDSDDWSLGLIGLPPGHLARPSYYAYALYAAHVGPKLLPSVSGLPAGVSAYATRNAADNTTALIVVNWNTAPVALSFQVTGLATAPAPPTYRLAGVSMAAIEIQDSGNATAWVYGEDERQAAVGPQTISQGTAPAAGVDGGAGGAPAGRTVGDNCPAADAGLVCTSFTATSDVITTNGMTRTTPPLMTFGSGTDAWGSYTYAGSGQTAPTAAVTSDGNGIQITAGFVAPVTANYEGVGLYYNSASCLDVTAYTGVQFDFSGTMGGCTLALGSLSSGDASGSDNPMRGACTASTSTSCYGPSYDVTAKALASTPASPTIKVPFDLLSGGMPISPLDPRTIITVQWQLTSPTGGACSAIFTVENVKFY
jgi:hypothetical protein